MFVMLGEFQRCCVSITRTGASTAHMKSESKPAMCIMQMEHNILRLHGECSAAVYACVGSIDT